MLRERHVMVLALAMMAILLTSTVWVRGKVSAQTPGSIVAYISVVRDSDTATYSITLRNPGDSDVKDIFIAGSIVQGTTFVGAGNNPAKGWFRGVEGGNAVFLSDGVPAMGWQGPFVYKVKLSEDTADRVWAWVHWRLPSDSTAISAAVRVLPSVSVAPLVSASIGMSPNEPMFWRVGSVLI